MSEEPRAVLQSIASSYVSCAACGHLGVSEDRHRAPYSSLALAALPQRVRVLFIAESAPKLNKRGRETYFYLAEDDAVTQDRSALFWALAEVLGLAESCGVTFDVAKESPAKWKVLLLGEFSARGMWLLDSAKCAVNGLREGGKRNKIVRSCAAAWLKREVEAVSPDKIVLIKANVYREVRPLIQSWGLGDRVLNDQLIPHPGSGQQEEFRKRLRAVLRSHPDIFPAGAHRAS